MTAGNLSPRWTWEKALRSVNQADKPKVLSSSVMAVGLCLATYVGKHQRDQEKVWIGYPGNRALAVSVGLGERSVQAHLQTLRDLGWIEMYAEAVSAWRAREWKLTIPEAQQTQDDTQTEGERNAATDAPTGNIAETTGNVGEPTGRIEGGDTQPTAAQQTSQQASSTTDNSLQQTSLSTDNLSQQISLTTEDGSQPPVEAKGDDLTTQSEDDQESYEDRRAALSPPGRYQFGARNAAALERGRSGLTGEDDPSMAESEEEWRPIWFNS